MRVITLKETGRGRGVYKLVWELGRVDGHRRSRTRTFRGSLAGAQRAWVAGQEEIERSQVRGTRGAARALTVADLTARFLTQDAGWRPATRANYRHIVETYVDPELGAIRLDRLTREHILAAERAWAARPRGGRTDAPRVSARTVHLALVVTRMALAAGVRWRWIGTNPAAEVDPPTRRAREATWWSEEEMAQFLAATSADVRYGSLYRVACLTGLRQAELLGLRWADIEWDGPALHVRQQWDRFGAMSPPKSAKGIRRIPIDAATATALRAQRAAQETERARCGPDYQDRGLVWATATGTPLSHRNLARRFKRDRIRAGVPAIRFHDVRHSHASALEAAGIDVRQLADRLGHAQIAFTLQTYTHARSERQRTAVDGLAATLAPSGDLLATLEGRQGTPDAKEKPR